MNAVTTEAAQAPANTGAAQERGEFVRISEPEPGRRLVETTDTGYVTTFLVEPVAEAKCRVTLHTTAPSKTGWLGRMEFALTRQLLLPAYERELALLAEAAGARIEGILPA